MICYAAKTGKEKKKYAGGDQPHYLSAVISPRTADVFDPSQVSGANWIISCKGTIRSTTLWVWRQMVGSMCTMTYPY